MEWTILSMPSKSSSDFSLHKSRGFHLKLLSKQKKLVSSSSKILNASVSSLQKTVSKQSGTSKSLADSCYSKGSSSTPRNSKETASKSEIPQGLNLQDERGLVKSSQKESKEEEDLKKFASKTCFKSFCTSAVTNSYSHLIPHREKTLLSARKKFETSFKKQVSSLQNTDQRKLITRKKFEAIFKRRGVSSLKKADQRKTVNKVVSLPNNLTVKAIHYKCKILQLHDKTCGCSSPRLHIYLTTNHRCSDTCSAETVHCEKKNISPSSAVDIAKNKYIFTVMTGKSKAKSNLRKDAGCQSAKKTLKKGSSKILQESSVTLDKKIKRNRNEEPESELLGVECDSLPAIMNTLSGDVEYIVLDDYTFNLDVNQKSLTSSDNSEPKSSTVHNKKSDGKSDTQSFESASVSKESKSWENIIEKCLSEVQSSKPKGLNQPLDIGKIKSEPPEEGSSFKSSENCSSLAEVCTNHCPSIRDIFGDVNVKDEPIDHLDDNDMSIEDFSQEIRKLTAAKEECGKTLSSKEEFPLNQDILTNKGLFAGLIKEENKAIKDDTKDDKSLVTNIIIKKEDIADVNDSQEDNDYSSDSSLGPLQIDEGDQASNEEETSSNISVPTVPTASLLLPSVNIISPFKIKILFGTPAQVQIEKQHELLNNSNSITEPVVGTSNTLQNSLMSNNISLKTPKLAEDEDSGADSMQALTSNDSHPVPNLTCAYCQTVSPDVKALAKHFEDHQKEGLIICYFCQKSFGDKTSLKRHMRTHTGEKPYLCKVCGKRFSLPGNFKKHRDIHEDIRTEPCKICGKTFRRKEHLKYHMRTHTGEKPYTCSECGTSFTARYSLQIHMNIHLGKKPYKCTFCSKAFSDKSTMRKHIRVHTGEKPFHCEMCGRCFGESGTLAAHMATHRTDRPFKCANCPLAFKTSGGLRQHEKVHIGLKLYACKYCGARFLQKYNMTMHERIHTGEKPYSCNQCDRSFRSRSCLAKHVVLHGGEEERRYECEHCNSKFYRKAHLRRHIDTHLGIKNHECTICSKKFCSRGSLDNHLQTFHSQGARRFPCSWCGRVFKRKVYVNTHECIRDPVKVEEYKKELRAAAAAAAVAATTSSSSSSSVNNPSISDKGNENSSDTEFSSIDIKSEPEEEVSEESYGLGKITSVIGNATFDIQQNIKQESS